MIIKYINLVNGLKELNNKIRIDTDSAYGGDGDDSRCGIYYNSKLISAIDNKDIPEYDKYNRPEKQIINVSPRYALNNKDTCTTQHILIEPDNLVMLNEVNQKLGLKDMDEINFGTYDVIATREKVVTNAGLVDDAIMLRRYFKEVELPTHVETIGWRHIFERIIAAKIPKITRQALNKKFKVVLKKSNVQDKTFEDYKQEATQQAQ
jgi:hypothetical protein